jgi:predicted HTH domain antitoxin
MVRMTIEVPESSLSALRKDASEFAVEMKLAAAVKWYEMGRISQGRAAEIAGLSRAEFINSLHRFGVTPFQVGIDELTREVRSE